MAAQEMNQFMQALQNFGKSLQGYAVQRTLRQANEQVQAIRQADMDEKEQQDNIRQIADNLSVYLLGQGASGKTIEQAREVFVGPKSFMETEEFKKQAELQRRGFQQQEQMLEERTKKSEAKEKRGTLNKVQKAYIDNLKGFRKAINSVKRMKGLIELDSPLAQSAAGVLMARGSGEVGNLSRTEQEIWKGRQDYLSRVLRQVKLGLTSKMTEGDKAAVKEVIRVYQKATENDEIDLANQLTSQLTFNPLFVEDDPNKLIRAITGNKVKSFRVESLAPETQQQLNAPQQSQQKGRLSPFLTPINTGSTGSGGSGGF